MLTVFAERLRLSRGDKSQAEAARLLGISAMRLSNYESGKREPDISLLKRLVEAYGVSADWLIGAGSPSGGVSLMASGGSVAANNSTVSTGGGFLSAAEHTRLLGITESQQAVIAALTGAGNGQP